MESFCMDNMKIDRFSQGILCPLDGEFSNAIFKNFYFKAFWHWNFVQNTLAY